MPLAASKLDAVMVPVEGTNLNLVLVTLSPETEPEVALVSVG